MKKKNLSSALIGSLKSEQDKFAAADEVLNKVGVAVKKREIKTEKKELPPKSNKEKLVRDAFTMPESDHALLAKLINSALSAGYKINKSEVVRAGLHLLNRLSKKELIAACEAVNKLKQGRPATK